MFKPKFIAKFAITTILALLASIQAKSLADSSTISSKRNSTQTTAIDTSTDGAKRKASGETAGTRDGNRTSPYSTVDTGNDTTANDGAKRKASGETAGVRDTTSQTKVSRIDLNTASRTDLESLPGVGPSTANAIIAARPFKSVADLKRVDGIGDVRFGELKNRVVVSHDRSTASGSPASTSTGSARVKSNSRETTSDVRANNSRTARINGRVNINTASKEELEALPGIGPVKSQAIIDARPFNSPEDIKNVKGIKEGEYGKIRDMISVR